MRSSLLNEIDQDKDPQLGIENWDVVEPQQRFKQALHIHDGLPSREGSAAAPLWDGFWQKQVGSKSLVHRLIWLARAIFSRRNARQLLDYANGHDATFPNPFRFLEVGCGSAATSGHISKLFFESRGYAIDMSLPAARLARRQNPGLICVVADAAALPFANQRFSLCFSSGVIEHFDRPDAHHLVGESCRVTQLEGTLGIIVPWKHSPYNLLRIICGDRWPFGNEDPFTSNELKTFAKHHDLAHVDVVASYWTTLIALGRRDS